MFALFAWLNRPSQFSRHFDSYYPGKRAFFPRINTDIAVMPTGQEDIPAVFHDDLACLGGIEKIFTCQLRKISGNRSHWPDCCLIARLSQLSSNLRSRIRQFERLMAGGKIRKFHDKGLEIPPLGNNQNSQSFDQFFIP